MSVMKSITPGNRLQALKECIARQGFARIMETHSGLSGIIAENVRVEKAGRIIEYDGLWESSLTDSASKGLPDASIVGFDSRIRTVDQILNVTTKPILVDGDTGGEPAQFEYLVKHLERLGASAVIIEDKVYPKRNSLDASASQDLEDPLVFAGKIAAGNEVKATGDFMIVARLESLIAGAGLGDALSRAECYIRAGADGIMIHANNRDPGEILAFAESYDPLCKRLGRRPALVCVPTTYNTITDLELAAKGFNVIIHANHLLRAAYLAMRQVALTILENDRSHEADALCANVREIFASVGHDRITEGDRKRAQALRDPSGHRIRTGQSRLDRPELVRKPESTAGAPASLSPTSSGPLLRAR